MELFYLKGVHLEKPLELRMFVVEGKVALVTGGAGGIGFAIVKEFLKNGARGVSIIDIVEESGVAAVKEIEEQFGPNKAVFIKTDVTDKTQLEQAFEKTVETYKQLDIVVNNAGIVDESNWKRVVAINLGAVIEGSLLAMKKYLPKYKSGEEGVIVNTSSVAALDVFQAFVIYSATKHGVLGLGRSLGGNEHYKKYKVRVLTMCPGVVNTGLLKPDDDAIQLALKEAEEKNYIAQEPEFIAHGLIEIIKNGSNGSVWAISNGNPPFEVPVPVLKELHK